jgi:membrane protease YdiL (CAAX protease family)
MAATVSAVRPPATSGFQAAGRRGDLVELGVFLFLIVPSTALSFFIPAQQEQLGFALTAVATILRDLALVALILFFLWRAGEAPHALGWTTRHLFREMALGVALFVPLFIGARWLEAMLLQLGLTAPSSPPSSLVPPRGAADLLLAVVLVIVVAISEETIFRGYLLLRLRPILRNGALALVLASMIFALGHGYEGSAGAVTVGAIGLAFGAVYLWRRSLVAPATMHFLLDAIAIVVVPLLR